MTFNLNDYVDVAERIRVFKEKYPDGSLQSHVDFVQGGVLCIAEAYRTPDDIRPGVGHAFEPIPGKTTFTKDSEVMNAETSAWGRAIVALGFETKKIASRVEVQNRSGPAAPSAPVEAVAERRASNFKAPTGDATEAQRRKIAQLLAQAGEPESKFTAKPVVELSKSEASDLIGKLIRFVDNAKAAA